MNHGDGEEGQLALLEPSETSREFVTSVYQPPIWATGYISRNDARFLYESLAAIAPKVIMEIGVASGVSTVFLLEAIDALRLDSKLYSFDIEDRYYAKRELPLGQHIFERYETWPDRLSLNPLVPSMRVADRLMQLAGRQADFTFIDAEHSHPWPCLDLLAIIKAVKPGSWVALHDINLPNLVPEFQCYGPLHLFDNWPGERSQFALGNEQANIGAIKLFDSVTKNVDAVLSIVEMPWDVLVDYRKFEQVETMLKAMGGGRAHRLRSIHYRNMPPVERRKYLIEKAKDVVRPFIGRPVRA